MQIDFLSLEAERILREYIKREGSAALIRALIGKPETPAQIENWPAQSEQTMTCAQAGRKGGHSQSEAKVKAVKQNIRLAIAARWAKKGANPISRQ